MEGTVRVKVVDAARELGVGPSYVRWAMEHGVLPIGQVVNRSKNRKTYLIMRPQLDAYIQGISSK